MTTRVDGPRARTPPGRDRLARRPARRPHAAPTSARLTPYVRALHRHLRARRASAGVLVLCVALGTGVPAWAQARSSALYPVDRDDLTLARAALAALDERGPPPTDPYDLMKSIQPTDPGGPTAPPQYTWDGFDGGQVWLAKQAKAASMITPVGKVLGR